MVKIGAGFKGITNDSRQAKKGYIFVAYDGVNQDLHNYIGEARQRGAALIIGEKSNCDLIVKDGRETLARLAAAWYDQPAQKLKLFAVTGTNGKTSTSIMLNAILNESSKKSAFIGTIGYSFGKFSFKARETTPDPLTLHSLFGKFSDAGASHAVLEATSQGLDQKRLSGLEFEVGIFTNLTRDHLDYHKTMKNYFRSKMILFEQSKFLVLNNDDPASLKI